MVSYRESFPKEGHSSDSFGHAVASFDPDPTYPKRKRKSSKSDPSSKPKISAYSRLIKLCTTRDRSQHELIVRLVRDGYTEEEARAAVKRAVDCNLVNDDRFAEAYIRGRLAMGKGSQTIFRELEKTYGIDPSPFLEHDDEFGFDDDSQIQRAVDFLIAHPSRAKNAWEGAYRKLISKGYPSAIARAAVRIWFENYHS